MAIFTSNFAGANNTNLLSIPGFSKFGSGTDSTIQLNGSNQLKVDTSLDCPLIGQNLSHQDHFVELVLADALAALLDNIRFQLVVRASDRNSKVWATFNPQEGVWELRASEGIGRFALTSSTANIGDVMRLEAEGTTYRLYKNGTQILAAPTANAVLDSQTACGLIINTFAGSAVNPAAAGPYRSGLISDLAGISGPSTRIVGGGYWS